MTYPPYHKIQSVFKRDPDTNYRTFLMGEWSEPTFAYLQDARWAATEKVDGTNCRIHVGSDSYVAGGRTERAELHAELFAALCEVGEKALKLGLDGLTLYGEGYGAGIQKGGGTYRPDKGFILFDVAVTEGGVFLERFDVEDIARHLGIARTDGWWLGTLSGAVREFVSGRPIRSYLREGEAEGWVLRPTVELRTRRGDRVITKIKVRDFPERKAL